MSKLLIVQDIKTFIKIIRVIYKLNKILFLSLLTGKSKKDQKVYLHIRSEIITTT